MMRLSHSSFYFRQYFMSGIDSIGASLSSPSMEIEKSSNCKISKPKKQSNASPCVVVQSTNCGLIVSITAFVKFSNLASRILRTVPAKIMSGLTLRSCGRKSFGVASMQ